MLEADVVHVMAHEEVDDEAAYLEEDHVEPESDDDTAPTGAGAPSNAEGMEAPVNVRDALDLN